MIQEFEKGDADRRQEVAAMVADADAFVGHLHHVSADRRKEVATILADADAFVRQLHRLSAARHVEVWGRGAPPPAVRTVAEGAPATLRDVIFTYLAEHPDGAKLAQMEQDLGMARIKLAQPMQGLIDGKKVQKRGLLYFAA